MLVHYQDNLYFSYYYNINYRCIAHIKVKSKFTIILSEEDENKIVEEINQYDYYKDFNQYLQLLTRLNSL